jgi:hypothetical protein
MRMTCECCHEPFDAEPVTEPACHRLLCADSTKGEDVRRVMAGAKADLFATDPPYLVDLHGRPAQWYRERLVG